MALQADKKRNRVNTLVPFYHAWKLVIYILGSTKKKTASSCSTTPPFLTPKVAIVVLLQCCLALMALVDHHFFGKCDYSTAVYSFKCVSL